MAKIAVIKVVCICVVRLSGAVCVFAAARKRRACYLPRMEISAQPAGKCRAWLELLRVPNLLTVPGDVLAGWLLAAGGRWHPVLLSTLAVSLGLYAFGLLSNDIEDFKTDARERPQRPLPSKRVKPVTAVVVTLALGCGAMLLAWLAGRPAFECAVLLFLVITLYNTVMKGSALFGPLTLGLCRGLNLLLGAAASIPVASGGLHGVPLANTIGVGAAAVLLLLYIAGVSALARREVETGRAHLIGALLRGLLPLQAFFCVCASLFLGAGPLGWGVAAALLALWPAAGWLGKRFYMS
jgi:4-hydroxybenzoate polyprenyltransferase